MDPQDARAKRTAYVVRRGSKYAVEVLEMKFGQADELFFWQAGLTYEQAAMIANEQAAVVVDHTGGDAAH